MKHNSKKESILWKFLNSAIGIWLLTSIFGGYGVWQFEQYLDQRKRNRELNDTYNKLALEFEGRLSHYSAWWFKTRHYKDTIKINTQNEIFDEDDTTNVRDDLPRLIPATVIFQNEVFDDCVTPEFLRKSIKILSGAPNFSNKTANNKLLNCISPFIFQSVFEEYSNRSTIGVLAEMRIINLELYPTIIHVDYDYETGKYNEALERNRKILQAINNFINPDAIVPENINDIKTFNVSSFREAFTESFYNIGSSEFYYGDCFAC